MDFNMLYRLARRSLLIALLGTGSLTADETPDFETEIAPILVKRCVECHCQPDPMGNLLLTSQAGLRQGGDSGAVIDVDALPTSHLLARVQAGEMPPPERAMSRQLPEREIALLSRWVAAGAPWPVDRQLDLYEQTTEVRAGRDWWSLQPVIRPELPQGEHLQPTHPIDAFVLAELDRQAMLPAPPADQRTLLRRLYFDLIGLPPTEVELAAFVADGAPDAWERAIDRLLATPQYGERWGRYWLDLARYADTSGYERDQDKTFAWKYRDWVVRAFNDDMPYGQFVVEQLAGDELPNRTEASVVATGFLRLGTWNDEPNDPLDYQYDRLEDLVHTAASTFLGLTVKCARCHAHKFDPIPQEDYYRFAAAFWAGPIAARDRELLGGPSASELGFENVLGWTDLSPTPPPLRLLKNGERAQPRQEVAAGSLSLVPVQAMTFSPPPESATTSQRRLQLARWIADTHNPLTPRVIVNRLWQHHFGQAIVRSPNNFGFLADPPTHPQLLDWLAAEFIDCQCSFKHMHKLILTSQTWRQSALHPQAAEYMSRDSTNRLWWRAERRRLDAEVLRDSLLAVSGELELSVGGESFHPTLSAEALEGLSRKSADWQASPSNEQLRRSLYMYMKRGLLPPLMTTFDLCDATQSCGQRDVTIVPTQALALLNNSFVHERSGYLAMSIMAEDADPTARLREAWLRILGRQPTPDELERAQQHVAAQHASLSQLAGFESAVTSPEESPTLQAPFHETLALASLCHVLMNSNEFMYID